MISTTEVHFPVAWYFDDAILAKEQQLLFSSAPVYLGTIALVPQAGDFHVLRQCEDAWFLVNAGGTIRMLSNICPHRGMLLLRGSGKLGGSITCPMHHWAFACSGQLRKAPGYPALAAAPCLAEQMVQTWQGLLFSGPRQVEQDLLPIAPLSAIDFGGYASGGQTNEVQPWNWKIPIEVFLDNYHLPFVHQGLNLFTDPCNWFQNTGSHEDDHLVSQFLPPSRCFPANRGSVVYQAWQERIMAQLPDSAPLPGMTMALYAPNTILEWWPFMFVATVYVPLAPERTLMQREYYFDQAVVQRDPDYARLARAAYDESQAEDEVLHAGLHAGRRALYRQDALATAGYPLYQQPTEECIRQFHQRLLEQLGPAPR